MSVFANGMTDQRIVVSISRFETREPVYNLLVAEDNSYVTECCTMHNCGSGTTLAVAEKLGRKWIGCDLGRFAIHTNARSNMWLGQERPAGTPAPPSNVGGGPLCPPYLLL